MFQHVPTLASGSAAASSSMSSVVDIAAAAKQKAKKDPYFAAEEIWCVILCHVLPPSLKRALQTGASLKLELNALALCHALKIVEIAWRKHAQASEISAWFVTAVCRLVKPSPSKIFVQHALSSLMSKIGSSIINVQMPCFYLHQCKIS